MSWFSRDKSLVRPLKVLKVKLAVSRWSIAYASYDHYEVRFEVEKGVRRALKRNRRLLVSLTISGYETDEYIPSIDEIRMVHLGTVRQLYENYEVCKWARGVRKRLPVLFYFLDSDSRQRYVTWLAGPFRRTDVGTTEFWRKYETLWTQCLSDVMTHARAYLTGMGASEQYIASLALSDAEWLPSERSVREVTRGVFTAMPSTDQVEKSAFPLEWEEDIPDLVSGMKCTCGKQLQLVRKHAVHGPSFLGSGFIGKTYLVAECCCSCSKKYFVATAPSKILKHWIGG